MSKNLSIVLDNIYYLHEVLGVNDSNLALIEELLGIKIYVKGNEIFLETDDESKRIIFKNILVVNNNVFISKGC